MRRLCSILLLALFGLSLASPLLSLRSHSSRLLPACCLSHGSHHCLLGTGATAQAHEGGLSFRPMPEKCPYAPHILPATHSAFALSPLHAAIAHALVATDCVAQSEAVWRIARAGARHKRGPPAEIL